MANKNIEREGPLVDEFLRHDLICFFAGLPVHVCQAAFLDYLLVLNKEISTVDLQTCTACKLLCIAT